MHNRVVGVPSPKHSFLLDKKAKDVLEVKADWLLQVSGPCLWDELGPLPEALSWPALVLWFPARSLELFSIVLGKINTH